MQNNFFRLSNWYFSWNMCWWEVRNDRGIVCGKYYWKTCWKRCSSQYWKFLFLYTECRKIWRFLRSGCQEGFQSLLRSRLSYFLKSSLVPLTRLTLTAMVTMANLIRKIPSQAVHVETNLKIQQNIMDGIVKYPILTYAIPAHRIGLFIYNL